MMTNLSIVDKRGPGPTPEFLQQQLDFISQTLEENNELTACSRFDIFFFYK